MIEEIKEKFESLGMLIVSFVFLLLSLGLLLIKYFTEFDLNPYIDFAWVTIIISGFPIIYEAIESLIKEKKITSELLIMIAMIASIIIAEVFAAAEVAFLMALGEYLEDLTVERAKKGIKNLINLTPTTAKVIRVENDIEKIVECDVNDVKIHDIVRILPGERVPVDGSVLFGESSIDQAILTGESMPVDVSAGMNVYAGTNNLYGSIDIDVTKEFEDSSLSKMIRLLKEAEENEAPIGKIADKWASILVPVSLLIALITFVLTYIISGNEGNMALIRGVTILVVFCPCALSLATPTSIMAGIGQATKHGVLIKTGVALEAMGKSNVFFFDKTGTLTYGRLSVSDVVSLSSFTKMDVLKIAASIESRSEHPLGKAILRQAENENLELFDITDFKMESGKGVSACIDGKTYYCGKDSYLNIEYPEDLNEVLDNYRSLGKAVVLLSSQNELIGLIALEDEIRESAVETIRKLKATGSKVVLLTGDNEITAKTISNKLQIDEVRANLLPIDKVKTIEEYKNKGYITTMIGDGINDAPALKAADTGISLEEIGSDITTEAASIVLLNDDIVKLPYLSILSKATVKTIKFNIIMSLIINIIAVVLSGFGLLTPITGAIVHNVGSLIIIFNASLLYDRNYYKKAENI
ncbi:cation-translocating P-type ATPase [bacterium]|nr:cation-translocating P-type ATPase [bacterium]